MKEEGIFPFLNAKGENDHMQDISKKPTVAIIATGGTIASKGATNLSLTDYGSNAGQKLIGIQSLIQAVPEITNIATITGSQLFNIGSSKLQVENLLELAQYINTLFQSDSIQGAVITHGTDTMEETAYFLNLVIKSDKPVVLVGSMRPATAISADGPLNLLNAVALAASPEAKGKGVMVCMNDQISSAFGVTKTNTTNAATFRCPDTGYLGYMQNFKPYFLTSPSKKHTYLTAFDVSDRTTLPRVDINYTYLGSDDMVIQAAIQKGCKGLINAGVGHGNMPDSIRRSLSMAVSKGIVVVAGSRVGTGMVTPVPINEKSGFISAMMHTPQKARILLMLALTRTSDTKEIQHIFNEY